MVDSAFRAYRAEARGHVYFFIDRPGSSERTLVKADQIALEVFWQAPRRTHQRIVGLRDRKVLPTNIRYHLDHLTVVQDDFGDRIRLGDGDEVASVLHPMAPGGPGTYDYRLADSLSIRFAGNGDEVRVYEILVRPKEPGRPGFVGSVFVDRANAAIVRMSFTFTPASYVDPYLDYIRISLDNALWEGRYWLPYRQEAELRRELPQLDFLAGSIIRGRFDVTGYEFNPDLPPNLFVGRGVTALPPAQRGAFPFEAGLFEELEREGLAPTPSLQEIQARAREMLTQQVLSGLDPLRLHFRSVSDVVRYNRAEGLFVGAGLRAQPDPDAALRATAGYSFGRKQPSVSLSASGTAGRIVPVVRAFWDEPRDLGPFRATAPVLGTIGALAFGEDHLDPYFSRGLHLELRGARPTGGPAIALRWEDQRSARAVAEGDRPVRPIVDGVLGAVEARVPLPVGSEGTGELRASLGRLGERTFLTASAHARWERGSPDDRWRWALDLAGGGATDEAPVQALFHLGGPGSLPGYGFRSFVGQAFGLARVEATRPLWAPWVGLRTFAAVGFTRTSAGAEPLPDGWTATDSGGLRPSLGAGLSLGWDVLRLDLARGLRDGRWQLVFSVLPAFHPWL